MVTLDSGDQSEQTAPARKGEHGETRYFRVLERAHELSRPSTPPSVSQGRKPPSEPSSPRSPSPGQDNDDGDVPAMGYYKRFFREEKRLGIGAEGSVYLATHIIGGNVLGGYWELVLY